MKLAALALITTLGLGGVAAAESAHPRAPLHQLLLEKFDRNHDGKLEPAERRRAARALRRLSRRMEMQDRAGHAGRGARGEARRRAALRRFDTNGDGVVSPDEMPAGAARKLRPLDQNRDGWVDDRDQP